MQISNLTFDEIEIGDTTTYSRLITNQEVEAFAAISGDHNPLHLDPDYAATTSFGECIAHGMLTGALISAAIAMQLPGPGSVYLSQQIQFRAPVFLGDTLTVTLTVTDKHAKRPWITLKCEVDKSGRSIRSPRGSAGRSTNRTGDGHDCAAPRDSAAGRGLAGHRLSKLLGVDIHQLNQHHRLGG